MSLVRVESVSTDLAILIRSVMSPVWVMIRGSKCPGRMVEVSCGQRIAVVLYPEAVALTANYLRP